ncbi:MAG: hypothetical protein BGN96_14675 [Bacteroidales bacterium 45-6]|nr:MAG: hypothetical protein BGN96_14675 [Bacteroidales bacterium 45-6]
MTPEISNLLEKYKQGLLTSGEFKTLGKWISESDENKRLVGDFIQFYKVEGRWNAFRNADPEKAYEAIFTKYRHKRKVRRIRIWSAAASIALILSVAGVFRLYVSKSNTDEYAVNFPRLKKHVMFTTATGKTKIFKDGEQLVCEDDSPAASDKEQYNLVKTEAGANFKLVLPDHSTVWLNSNTTIRYAANFSKTRKIILSGEAFFEVTKNGLPFLVEVDKNTVRVLGTRFNVSAYNGRNMETTLVRGSVEVSNLSGKQLLKPNQQASISQGDKFIHVKEVNTDIYTSWIDGVFEFRSIPLSQIMEQLAQWYDIRVVYENPQLKDVRFTGSLYKGNALGYTLQIIEDISEVQFRNENGKIYIYK